MPSEDWAGRFESNQPTVDFRERCFNQGIMDGAAWSQLSVLIGAFSISRPFYLLGSIARPFTSPWTRFSRDTTSAARLGAYVS